MLGLRQTLNCFMVILVHSAINCKGFWGSCFNDYRKTKPHEGYRIVKSWKQKFFSKTSHMRDVMYGSSPSKYEVEPYTIEELQEGLKTLSIQQKAGPFFIYTSNVFMSQKNYIIR